MEIVKLPLVVCGERKEPTDSNYIALKYKTGIEVHIPALESADIEKMKANTNEELRSLHIDDIAIFLNDLGKLWLDENFKYRKMAIDYARKAIQYVGPSIYYDLGLLSSAMRRGKIYDMLEADTETDRLPPCRAAWQGGTCHRREYSYGRSVLNTSQCYDEEYHHR